MSNFSERTRSLLNAEGTKMNLSKEQKEALLKVQNAGNADVYEKLVTSVSTIDIAKAVEAATNGTQQSSAEVFASQIDLAVGNGEHKMIPCATSKATNVVTGDLKDATVWKLTQSLQVVQVDASVARAAIRSDKIMPFTQKSTDVTDDIVKKASIRDFSTSGTVFPEDIRKAEELNKYLAFTSSYKYAMMGEFLEAAGKTKLTDDQKMTIYRCASRSMAEDYFDKIWSAHFPLYDNSNGAEVRDYQEAKRAYLNSLDTIGSKYMSNCSVTFGMSIRKLSISPNMKWTSEAKVGHVKKFGDNKSYFVGSNIDSGIQTVPTTTGILQGKLKDIITLTVAGAYLIEAETRLENGLSGQIEIPDYSSVKYNEGYAGKPYYQLLNITEDEQIAIYERIGKAFEEQATTVIAAIENRLNLDSASTLKSLLNK